MKLYRSLIYREWKLTRRHYVIRLIMALLLAVLMFIPLYFGSRGEADADLDSVLVLFSSILAASTAILASSDNEMYKKDLLSGWKTYSHVLPVTANNKAAVSTFFKIAGFLAGALIISVYIIMLDSKMALHMINLYLISFALAFLVSMVSQFIQYMATDKKTLQILRTVGFIAAMAVFILIDSVFSRSKAGTVLRNSDEILERPEHENIFSNSFYLVMDKLGMIGLTVICIAAIAGLFCAHYKISEKFFGRREP